MKRSVFILLFITLSSINVVLAQQTFPKRLGKGFQQYNDRSPQEKVYLHLDKSSYAAGENIWLKAYLTDATYHVPDLLSKYIYVELIDRSDSICQQIKLRQTDSCFYGNFRLPIDIKPGKYCIRAYTFPPAFGNSFPGRQLFGCRNRRHPSPQRFFGR